jgi:hypothetical protein
MAFAPISGVKFRSLKTFGHCNFVRCKEILVAQRCIANFAMPDAWRSVVCSVATIKPWQAQQMTGTRPDSAMTTNREGLPTEPYHALFARRVESCRNLCSNCCRIICLSRIGLGTFAPSGCTPTFIPARLRAQDSSYSLCEPSLYADATKYIRLSRHFHI